MLWPRDSFSIEKENCPLPAQFDEFSSSNSLVFSQNIMAVTNAACFPLAFSSLISPCDIIYTPITPFG